MTDEGTMPMFNLPPSVLKGVEEYAYREVLASSGLAAATDGSAVAKARLSDPVTSHQAAQKVTQIALTQGRILNILQSVDPMHDQQIADTYYSWFHDKVSESGLRTRRAELVAKGLVKDSGKRVKLPSGRSSIVWEATNDLQNSRI